MLPKPHNTNSQMEIVFCFLVMLYIILKFIMCNSFVYSIYNSPIKFIYLKLNYKF